MLRWLVVGAADLDRVPTEFDGALSVLTETDTTRAAALETKRVVRAARPVYCEVPVADLGDVQRTGCFAKVRTGGVKPEAIPSVAEVAAFIRACADRRLAFKATAGLHHPVRARKATHLRRPIRRGRRCTGSSMCSSPPVSRGTGSATSNRSSRKPTRRRSSSVTDRCWRAGLGLDGAVRDARTHFVHAFGSCSFDEPVRDLEALGLL